MNRFYQPDKNESLSLLSLNIQMAIVASCAIAIPYYFLLRTEAIERYGQTDFPNLSHWMLLSNFPTAFLLAGVLLWFYRNTFWGRKIPNWLSIAFIGSPLLIVIFTIFFLLRDGDFALSHGGDQILRIAFVNLALSIYIASFTGLYYLVISNLARIKRWVNI